MVTDLDELQHLVAAPVGKSKTINICQEWSALSNFCSCHSNKFLPTKAFSSSSSRGGVLPLSRLQDE